MEVEAGAGGSTFAAEITEEHTRWYLPEAMVRHEGDANLEALCILRVRGDSMAPKMREGDRLLVDTARRSPATGEFFVLFDGTGLVVKRVEMVPGEARLRLLSANPAYGPYTPRSAPRSTSSTRWSGCSAGCEGGRLSHGARTSFLTRAARPVLVSKDGRTTIDAAAG